MTLSVAPGEASLGWWQLLTKQFGFIMRASSGAVSNCGDVATYGWLLRLRPPSCHQAVWMNPRVTRLANSGTKQSTQRELAT